MDKDKEKTGALGCRLYVGDVWPIALLVQVTAVQRELLAAQAAPVNKGQLGQQAALWENTAVCCL